MKFFDVSLGWVILAPFPVSPAAEDLARCIAVLRGREGLGEKAPPVLNAAGPAPEDSAPLVVLNMGDGNNERGGYGWRTGRDRVEIYGDSLRGFCNGVYSFLGALGFSWPGPGQEFPPPSPGHGPGMGGPYPLKEEGAHVRSNPAPEKRRRLVIPPGVPGREIAALGRWAARNQVDALIFSLRDRRFGTRKSAGAKLAGGLENSWGLLIERGGWDMGFLIPRSFFFFKRELFRMEGGRRRGDHHFCPTNPETIALLRRRMEKFLGRRDREESGAGGPGRIYHLWPDQGAEHVWCACPACRAFMPREQIRLAVNAAAAAIAEREPRALVSCRGEEESPSEKLPGGSEIVLAPNVFRFQDPEEGAQVYTYEKGLIRQFPKPGN